MLESDSFCNFDFLRTSSITGLNLLPEETHLFSRKQILPFVGLGRTENVEPCFVIAYQLSVDTCPYLTKRNQCKIYDRRPFYCRAYPLKSTFFGPILSRGCPAIRQATQVNEFMSVFEAKGEWESYKMIFNYYRKKFNQFFSLAPIVYLFDLKTKKWKILAYLSGKVLLT